MQVEQRTPITPTLVRVKNVRSLSLPVAAAHADWSKFSRLFLLSFIRRRCDMANTESGAEEMAEPQWSSSPRVRRRRNDGGLLRSPDQSLTAPLAMKQGGAPAMSLKLCGRLLAALFHRPLPWRAPWQRLPWNWNSHFGHCSRSCPCCRRAVPQSIKGDDYLGTCGHCETARALRALLFRISQFPPISHIDTAVLATRLSSSYQLGCFTDDVFESDAESD